MKKDEQKSVWEYARRSFEPSLFCVCKCHQSGRLLLQSRKLFGPSWCWTEMPRYLLYPRSNSLPHMPEVQCLAACREERINCKGVNTAVRLGRVWRKLWNVLKDAETESKSWTTKESEYSLFVSVSMQDIWVNPQIFGGHLSRPSGKIMKFWSFIVNNRRWGYMMMFGPS